MQRQITTEQIIGAAIETLKGSLYIRMPGSIVSYDPTTCTATVQPMVNDVRFDLETDAVVFEPWPPIPNVPICFPRMGGITICAFLEPQDPVILEAFDLDPTSVWQQGRSSNPVNPNDVRRLSGNYWSATPTDLTGPVADAPSAQGMIIGIDGQLQQVCFDASYVYLGRKATATDFVALASKVDACMLAIKSHTHPVPASGLLDSTGHACTGSATSSTSGALASLPATGSSLIKAQ